MKSGWRIIPILVISVACAAWAAPDRIAGTIDNSQTVLLKSNVHPKALPEYDQGPVEPSTELGRITMMFQASTSQQADLKKLLAQQQDPASPNYHKWLSPEQYAERFGLSQGDINKISEWLRSQGFSIVEVARGQERIAFSGTAEMVQNAFHTAIHRYNVDGEMHIANATAPSIPSGLAGVVTGFLGLNDFGPKPMGLRKPAQGSALLPNIIMHPYYDGGGGNNFLGPDDLATIYDINSLYTAGINGTGMKMVIVGQTDLNMSGGKAIDIDNFRAGFSLPVSEPVQILATGCIDPGISANDLGESNLDLEWAGAVARNATIDFIKCDANHGGVFESLFYSVDNQVAPVISMSYGACESANAPLSPLEVELTKANTEGITVMASSGDSGAAACDPDNLPDATHGLAVSYPASSPEVTGVGGNEFDEGTGNYWNTGTVGGSALSYIPEMGWNDSDITGNPLYQGPTLAASGGGKSSCGTGSGGTCAGFTKPSWQTTLTPKDGVRDVPDVSMTASANHDGYIYCNNNSCPTGNAAGIADAVASNSIVGGTSASTPVFAGVIVLLNQYLVKNGTLTKPGLGNINPALYQLAGGGSASTIFHDVTTGTNIVPCTQATTGCPATAPFQYGYTAKVGYDQVTGIGSVDANVLVTKWAGGSATDPTTTALVASPASPVFAGTSVTLTATINHTTGTAAPTGSVTFANNGKTIGTGTVSGGVATLTTTTLSGGADSLTAAYGGDSNYGKSTSPAVPYVVEDFSTSANPSSLTASGPSQVTSPTTLTISSLGGFSQAVTLTCSLPTGATCSFSPPSPLTPTATKAATTTMTITAPASAKLDSPFGRSSFLYAMLLPGFFGLVVLPMGNRKRSWRWLGIITILAVAVLWMPACGGGSTTPSGGGTTQTNTTVTVTATAPGGPPAITHAVTMTLIVK